MSTFTRRLFLVLAFSALAVPQALADYSYTDYSPAALAEARASGEPFLVDFYAPWCVTCRAQERIVIGLYEGDSKYNAIKVIRVDWDTYRQSELVANWQIPRRSTLVLIAGDTEIGRLVADARPEAIKGLLDLAF
ncbi:MAG TPA: thioredoxin family protein [Devosiaceae bacterium]|nr:thioredoxin family protein [Devosiaceae bacterium]